MSGRRGSLCGMGARFIGGDREQVFLLPPSVRDWVPEDHLVWTVLEAVEELDLSAFYADYRQDGHGRPAYEPSMMVALLLYAYTRGVRSSRAIERACVDDVASRVVTGNVAPDHSTIAEFRCRHERPLADVFSGVLGLCARAGLVSVGVVAIDGTKIAANASLDANRDFGQIAREILAEAAETDRREDELYGDTRGDELPEHLRTREGRRKGVREGRRALESRREREGRPIAKDRSDRLFEACRRLEEELDVEHASHAAYDAWRARGVAADGSRRMAPGMVKRHETALVPTGTVNTTDHDSRVMRTQGQPPLQGYNAQLAVNDRQVIVAAEVTTDAPDFGHLEPMVRATQRELRGVFLDEPGIVVADAGYWHQRQIETVVSEGIEVLVPPDSGLRTSPRPGWTGGLYDFMRRVLATPAGRAAYRTRQVTIEPVFGQLKFNRLIRRFQRRGRAACRSEWRLIAATHNLLKLHNHRLAAVTA